MRDLNVPAAVLFLHAAAASYADGNLKSDKIVARPEWRIEHGKDQMRDATIFRKYAEECRKLALKLPQHKETLLRMADAWLACAKDAEKHQVDNAENGRAKD